MASIAYLDTTCLHDIVRSLDQNRPDACTEWSWRTAIESSCALISSDNIAFPPSPTRDGIPSGVLGSLVSPLGNVVRVAQPSDDVAKLARRATKAWGTRNLASVRATYTALTADTAQFRPWLDWSTERVWTEHSKRLNGLFDPDFIPLIGKLLDVDRKDLQEIWAVSSNERELTLAMRAGEGNPNFDLLRSAYIYSALIRGKYHDEVARRSGWQIMHHPLRSGLFSSQISESAPVTKLSVTNTERYLANILMASAFSVPKKQRIDRWSAGLRLVRQEVMSGRIDLREKDTDDIALELAVKAARSLDLELSSRALEGTLGTGSSLGVGALTTFYVVGGWPTMAVTVGMAAGQAALDRWTSFDPKGAVARKVNNRSARLTRLAQAGPGRIQRRWQH